MSDATELDALRRISDRLSCTPDDQLSAILDRLLPKVLLLASDLQLRESVIALVSQVMRRVKPLRTILPCAALLSQLVRADQSPFVSNIAVAFVDVGLPLESTERKSACADALIRSLCSFVSDPFCVQAQSLCNCALALLEFLPDAFLRAGAPPVASNLLEDWFLDVALSQAGMKEGASGSILPGLSDRRVGRLLAKRPDGWSAPDLNALKLRLLRCIGQSEERSIGVVDTSITAKMRKENRLVGIAYSVLITVVLVQQDGDTNVTTQANFKLNGCISAMKEALLLAEEADDNTSFLLSAECALSTLLTMSSTPYPGEASTGFSIGIDKRTNLRPDVRAAVLRWIAKEASDYLVDNALKSIKCVHSNFFGSPGDQSQPAVRLKLASLHLLEKLLAAYPTAAMSQLDLIAFGESDADGFVSKSYAAVLFEIAMVALSHSMPLAIRGTGGVNGGLAYENSDQIETRRLVYNVMDRICRVFPDRAVQDASILQVLFRLLPTEDEAVLPSLFCALGALKTAFELHDAVAGLTWTTDKNTSLESLLRRSRSSPSPKPRLVALTWCRSLYKWNDFAIDTMFFLLGDKSEVVSNAVVEEFRKLKKFLHYDVGSDLSSSQHILISLTNLLPSLLSQALNAAPGSGDRDACYLPLYHCLGCITIGLKGLSRAANIGISTSVLSPDSADETDHTILREILEEYPMSYWSPVQWPSIPFLISAGVEKSNEAQCINSIVTAFASVVLNPESPRAMLESVLSSREGFTYNGTERGEVEEDSGVPLLGELILHVLYQVSLLRGEKSIELCKTMQNMSPQLLSLLNCNSDIENSSFNTKIIAECVARLLSLMCLLDLTPSATAVASIDVNFLQDITRSINHKIASTVESGLIRSNSCATVCYAIRCVEAIVEIIACCPALRSEIVDYPSTTFIFCSDFCCDLIFNSVECLEKFTGNENAAVSHRHQKLLNPSFINCALRNSDITADDATSGQCVSDKIIVAILRIVSSVIMRGMIIFDSGTSAETYTSAFNRSISDTLKSVSIDKRLFSVVKAVISIARERVGLRKRSPESTAVKVQCLIFSASLDVMGRLFLPGKIFSLADYGETLSSLWDFLVNISSLSIYDGGVRFSMAECISKMAMSQKSSQCGIVDDLILFSEGVVFSSSDDKSCYDDEKMKNVDMRSVKGTIATIILVFLKQSCDRYNSNSEIEFLNFTQLNRFCVILLKLLGTLEKLSADSDPLVQDACCAGLCFCYQYARCLDLDISKADSASLFTAKKETSFHEVLANTVIYTLTRDKKLTQPVGMAPAGDRASPLDREAPSNPSEAANAGVDEEDPLAAAAAEAAARIGLSAADLSALLNADRVASDARAMGSMRSDRVAASEGDYGVYSKVCKVAKKSGDPSVVFSVLALIRRNPAVIGSSILYETYWPQLAQVDPSKQQMLLPMLYVSKFDPSPPVKSVMKSLWERLIPSEDVNILVTAHTDGIIRYALCQTKSHAWRDRECGCLALEALISQRSWEEVFPFLDDLWYAGMQVLDDIRDSTRTAAIGYTKVLSQQIMRACSPETNPKTTSRGVHITGDIAGFSIREKKRKRDEGIRADLESTTAVVIPILLDKGLVAESQEGRGFSLGLLVQVVKVSRESLQEHLVRIIDVLIESMAAMEPRTLQYMQFHTARLNISDKELEDLRLTLSQNSPMQEALDICLQSLPACYLPSVIYQLGAQLRGGVGLATRVSAVKSLIRLMETSNLEFRKRDGALARVVFESCLSVLLQFDITSTGLKSSMLGCLAAAAFCVSGDYLSKQCLELVDRYASQFSSKFEATESMIIAECLGQVIRRAGEQLEHDSASWAPIMSCSYIGSFHPDDDIAKAWMATWNEALTFSGCGTKYSAIVKIFPLAVNQVCELLHSLSWNQRTVGMAVCRDISSAIPFEIIKEYVQNLLSALLSCIKFRIWNGQALALETLVAILEKYPCMYVYDAKSLSGVVKTPILGIISQNSGELKSDDENSSHQYVLTESILRTQSEGGAVEVSCAAVIELLLTEAVRGEKPYRYGAAKSLSEMHASWMHLAKCAPISSLKYLKTICALAGLTTGSASTSPITVSAATTKPPTSSRTAQPSSCNMFGDRYSKHLPIKGSMKPSTGAGRAGRSSRQSSEVQYASVTTRTGDQKTVDAIDPAFRVKLMECIYFGWPVGDLQNEIEVCPSTDSVSFSNIRQEVLVWIYRSSKDEIWSIKRQGLLILSSIIFKWSHISKEELSAAVNFITDSYRLNAMHNQVREAALFCLRRLLEESKQPSVIDLLKGEFAPNIRMLLLQAQSDSAPGVQDELQRIRSKWRSPDVS